MNAKEFVLGIVIFVVFWAFQAGYLNVLGTATWFVGVIVFSILLWLVGWAVMKGKSPADVNMVWKFSMVFVIVSTFIISFLGPWLGAVFPPGFDPSAITPLVLSFWLVVYGGAMFATGHKLGSPMAVLIGIIWLFSAIHFVTSVGTGANSYLHFGLVTGFVFIIEGLIAK